MLFYHSEPPKDDETPPNEAKLLNLWPRRLALLGCAVGGLLYAAALPPLNFSFCAAIALLPVLIYVSMESRWYWCAFAGWLWGWCWAICSYSFLREIEWIVPWLMAPVIAMFPAVWALLAGRISRRLLIPPLIVACGMDERLNYLDRGPRVGRMVMMGITVAALYIAIEYTRSRLFVWNDLAVTQYRNVYLLQIAALTGSYGVSFGVVLVNCAGWMLCFRRGWRAALWLAGLAAAWFFAGWCYTAYRNTSENGSAAARWKVLAIQGDLSQRRHATIEQVEESLTIYETLSRQALTRHPDADIVIWPESAIPILFASNYTQHDIPLPRGAVMNARYQSIVRNLCLHNRKKLLFGALDIEEASPRRMKKNDPPLGVTNSALLFDEWGGLIGRYDKFHRVPFGEYIPFRRFLPECLIKMVDMGRDLVPGATLAPLTELTLDDGRGGRCPVRIGVVICYEGVFSYVTRGLFRRGANILVALSNDAWYPRSSEPEQHLANATLRAVECGIPMIRVGNNSGTGIVMPSGRFDQALEVPGVETRPEIRRGRGFRLLDVPIAEYPNPTVYMCIGEVFPLLMVALSVLMFIYSVWHDRMVLNIFDEIGEDPGDESADHHRAKEQ